MQPSIKVRLTDLLNISQPLVVNYNKKSFVLNFFQLRI